MLGERRARTDELRDVRPLLDQEPRDHERRDLRGQRIWVLKHHGDVGTNFSGTDKTTALGKKPAKAFTPCTDAAFASESASAQR